MSCCWRPELICAASLAGYFFWPDTMRLWSWSDGVLRRTTRLVGITGHANAIGGIAAIGVLSARIFWGHMRDRPVWPRAGAALICVTALLLSQSRTSLGALLIVLALYQLRNVGGRARPMVVILIAGFFALGLILVSGYGANSALGWIARSGRVTEILTLSGRTSIWSAAIDLWLERPLLGWGYGSGDFIIPKLSYAIGFEVSQSHSVFLQVLVASGLVGLTLLVVAIGVAARSLVVSRSAEAAGPARLGIRQRADREHAVCRYAGPRICHAFPRCWDRREECPGDPGCAPSPAGHVLSLRAGRI